MDSRTGEPITAAQAGNGAYIWRFQIPFISKIISHFNRPFPMIMDILTIRIQFNSSLGKLWDCHKCFLPFRIWTTLQPQTGPFLWVFKTQVLKYLNNLAVISINLVIKAVEHVLYNVIQQTMYVDQYSEIKFKLH
uniref:Replication enhancer n=1 Tax=Cotton leaf curl Multan virus TaxID=223252 RepID=B9TVF1_9GEMI|nr:relication enhancer protein [Cotton leaf curl Multan virus]